MTIEEIMETPVSQLTEDQLAEGIQKIQEEIRQQGGAEAWT